MLLSQYKPELERTKYAKRVPSAFSALPQPAHQSRRRVGRSSNRDQRQVWAGHCHGWQQAYLHRCLRPNWGAIEDQRGGDWVRIGGGGGRMRWRSSSPKIGRQSRPAWCRGIRHHTRSRTERPPPPPRCPATTSVASSESFLLGSFSWDDENQRSCLLCHSCQFFIYLSFFAITPALVFIINLYIWL